MMDLRGRELRISEMQNPEGYTYEIGDEIRVHTVNWHKKTSDRGNLYIHQPELSKILRN